MSGPPLNPATFGARRDELKKPRSSGAFGALVIDSVGRETVSREEIGLVWPIVSEGQFWPPRLCLEIDLNDGLGVSD